MKRFFAILAVLLLPWAAVAASTELDSLLTELDRTIDRREHYRAIREERISYLKSVLTGLAGNYTQLYNVNSMLADAYKPYQLDSALHYMHENLAVAARLGDRRRTDETNLRMAHLYTTSGYYVEARDILRKRLDTLALDNELLGRYYVTMARYNSENRQYSHNPQLQADSYNGFIYYTQRIIDHFPPDHERHLCAMYDLCIDSDELEHAGEIVDRLLERTAPENLSYAMYAYMKAIVEERSGRFTSFNCWLTRSAIADLHSAIRDNASLTSLSNNLFRHEINADRAFAYIQIATNDALFYNARLRPWQIASILPAIESSYLLKQHRQLRTISWMSIGISVLFIVACMIATVAVHRGRRTEQMRRKLEDTNRRMEEYIRRLSEINDTQTELNNEIREANAVKEEYIGLFLGICSDYIDKMKEYQRSVRKRLAAGSAAEVYKELGSSTLIDSYIEEFYRTFDNTFLRLYPNFVQEFNSLLREDARIELKKDRSLNTELRIFALIRLGITDSSKIAALLRYSVNTIYNYRAKVKNNASVSRENFEERIKKIGSYQEEQ